MDLTRATMTAAGAPTGFWEHAILHATDILSRKSGPPNTAASSYELLTGDKPRVMSILPFGCRAFAVKPRTAYSKTHMDARAWVGINLLEVIALYPSFLFLYTYFTWIVPSITYVYSRQYPNGLAYIPTHTTAAARERARRPVAPPAGRHVRG
eukprot:50106-Pleurochrysis_carterae.AAC.2